MAVKVAINGFGRIGRLAFRQMFGHEGSEIVAINDLTSPDMLAYLLKYDSTQGNYSRDHKVEATEDSIIVDGKEIKIYAEADANNLPWGDLDVDVVLECTGFYTSKAVEATEDSIIVDGKEIKIYAEADANNLPWGDLDVDVVLECTGFYTSKAKAQAHINAGAKKVVISAPAGNDLPTIVWGDLDVDVVLECTGFYTSKAKAQAHINAGAKKVVISAPAGNDLPTIVYNVNHESLTAEDNIISAASCTTNCLAPMAKGLNDFAPIVAGIMTTIHAWTGDQMPLDGPQRKGNKRRGRACAVNIVPNSTGAAKAIGLVLPELNGKLIGAAQRVPTPTGSLTNLYAVVDKQVTVDEVNAAMKAYAETISETFGYNEDEIVSTDIIGETHGSIFVLPELNGKLIGAAQRVPTPTGSLTNLYAVVDKVVTVDEVNAAMKAYA